MVSPWKKLSSKIAYQNKWYKVREDEVIRPNGEKGMYAVVETPPSVFVVALTEDQEVYLVGLYRYPTGKYQLELPAGGSDNQNLLSAAKRELLEETGLEAGDWEKVGEFQPFNGISNETSHVFLAQDLSQTLKHKKKEEGIEEIRILPFKDVFKMIKSGEINDGQTIAALTLATLHINNQVSK